MHFFTKSLQGVCDLLSHLLLQRHQVCCNGHACLLLRCATAAAAADLEGLQPAPLAMTLNSAPLPSQMELCFGTRLEPTRMRWKSAQVCTTVLRQGKQMCRSVTVPSPCEIQHFPSAWAGFAPKLTTTLTVTEIKSLSWHTLRSFVGCSPIPWNMATPSYNTTLACKFLRMSSSHGRGDQLNCPLSWNLTIEHRRILSCCPSRRKVFPVVVPC